MTMRIDGKRWVSMPMAVLVTILGATITAAIAFGTSSAKVDGYGIRIDRIESKLEDVREMRNDISWIKQTMERERRMER